MYRIETLQQLFDDKNVFLSNFTIKIAKMITTPWNHLQNFHSRTKEINALILSFYRTWNRFIKLGVDWEWNPLHGGIPERHVKCERFRSWDQKHTVSIVFASTFWTSLHSGNGSFKAIQRKFLYIVVACNVRATRTWKFSARRP